MKLKMENLLYTTLQILIIKSILDEYLKKFDTTCIYIYKLSYVMGASNLLKT